MFIAGFIENENIAVSHMIWTKVWSVQCKVATGSNLKLSLSLQLTPNNNNQMFPSTWCFFLVGWLYCLCVIICLLFNFFRGGLVEQSQQNGRFPLIPKRTILGLFKRTGRHCTYESFPKIGIKNVSFRTCLAFSRHRFLRWSHIVRFFDSFSPKWRKLVGINMNHNG